MAAAGSFSIRAGTTANRAEQGLYETRGGQIFQQTRSHLQTSGIGTVTYHKLHTLRTHKYQVPPAEFRRRGQPGVPDFCTPTRAPSL